MKDGGREHEHKSEESHSIDPPLIAIIAYQHAQAYAFACRHGGCAALSASQHFSKDKEEPGERPIAPPGSRPLCSAKLTHSSGATRREESLLTPPVRIRAVHGVVGDLALTTPAD